MNLKKKFCRLVNFATFTPPVTKIPGSAPGGGHKRGQAPVIVYYMSFLTSVSTWGVTWEGTSPISLNMGGTCSLLVTPLQKSKDNNEINRK